MIDHPLRTISYIADIGNIVVLMARRRLPPCDSQEKVEVSDPSQDSKHQQKMMCHVFESEDVSLTTDVYDWLAVLELFHPKSGVSPGPADCPVHRPGLQRSIPGISQGEWDQPRGPQSDRIH